MKDDACLTVSKATSAGFNHGNVSADQYDIGHVVQSAAHSTECAVAVFCSSVGGKLEVVGCFGLENPTVADSSRVLADAAKLRPGDLLIVNDVTYQPGFAPRDGHLFGADAPPVRFIAAAPVPDDNGGMHGMLIVADPSPHAGMSAAKTYVLRTHAAQIAALLELQVLRRRSGDARAEAVRHSTERLRLLESVVVNANDAVLITEAEPVTLPGRGSYIATLRSRALPDTKKPKS